MKASLRAQVLNGLVLGGVGLIFFCAGHMSSPPPVVQEIQGAVRYVDRVVIESREPDAKVGRLERISRPTVRADYVAIARGAGDSTVNAFCKENADSLTRSEDVYRNPENLSTSPILNRSIRTDSRLFPWQRSSLYAVSVSGAGDLIETRYQVRQGYSLRADSDSLVVQNPRIPVKPILGAGLIFGAGLLVGAALQ